MYAASSKIPRQTHTALSLPAQAVDSSSPNSPTPQARSGSSPGPTSVPPSMSPPTHSPQHAHRELTRNRLQHEHVLRRTELDFRHHALWRFCARHKCVRGTCTRRVITTVVGDGSTYDSAYLKVQRVRVFETSSDMVVSTPGVEGVEGEVVDERGYGEHGDGCGCGDWG